MNLFKVVIPKDAEVLLLEDSPMRIAWFTKRVPHLKVVGSSQEFIKYFESRPTVDFIFFDHDLGEGNGNGAEAAKWVSETFGGKDKWMMVHSWNQAGVHKIQEYLKSIVAIPFGNFDLEVEQ